MGQKPGGKWKHWDYSTSKNRFEKFLAPYEVWFLRIVLNFKALYWYLITLFSAFPLRKYRPDVHIEFTEFAVQVITLFPVFFARFKKDETLAHATVWITPLEMNVGSRTPFAFVTLDGAAIGNLIHSTSHQTSKSFQALFVPNLGQDIQIPKPLENALKISFHQILFQLCQFLLKSQFYNGPYVGGGIRTHDQEQF